ncbi:sulfotransferase, partial [Alphaproteobacteria bacterium]|nr:sulfotransferase [Alphaproteobacteria bacterium]
IEKRNFLKSQQPENINFDKNIILSVIKNYQDYFTFKNSKQFKKNSLFKNYINPTFLIGFPRSGTTLLDNILRSHSRISVLEEKSFLSTIRDEFFQINYNKLESIEGLNKNQIIILQKKYNQLIENDYGKNIFANNIVIDKFPLNIIEMGFIKKIFPDSKFIVAIRHPCDVIVSCFTTNFKINEGMANFYTLRDAANLYNRVFALYNQYKTIFADDVYEIKYENIIYNFDITINSLLEFLDVKWEDNLKAFNSTAKSRRINTPSYTQVIEPLYNNSINRWKGYKEIEKAYPLLKKWIKEFNY